MPRGLANSNERDPRNFTLAQWQQAKRTGKDPRGIKAVFQDAWAISDSRGAFINAMEERGYKIARGCRRGYVAVDYQGEIYAIAKWAGVKTKEVRSRLGDKSSLPDIQEVKKQIAQEMLSVMGKLKNQLDSQKKERNKQFEIRRQELVAKQRTERNALKEKHEQRQTSENIERKNRYRKGIMGFWDRLSGTHSRIKKQNEHEAHKAELRDMVEKDAIITLHLEQQKHLNYIRIQEHSDFHTQKQEIQQDVQDYKSMLSEMRDKRIDKCGQERKSRDVLKQQRKHSQNRYLEH